MMQQQQSSNFKLFAGVISAKAYYKSMLAKFLPVPRFLGCPCRCRRHRPSLFIFWFKCFSVFITRGKKNTETENK